MIYLIIVLAVLARFLPHAWNFSPVYGALLFGGARLNKRESIWFPALLLGISDVILTDFVYQLHFGWREIFQVVAFASISLAGWLLREHIGLRRFLSANAAGATAFYLISNFGVWVGWHTYPPTWSGLVQCCVAAIPFFGRTLGSTIIFSAVLFGAYEYWRRAHHVEARSHMRTS
jgi:uncharacterized protein DUF6580